MMDPDRPQAQEPELLAKVLPAGGPLVSTTWTCPTCGITVFGAPPSICLDDRPGCPVEGAQ